MWKDKGKAPIGEFLGLLLLIFVLSESIILFLEPYSIAFTKHGTLTAGYVIYAVTGILFTTQNPMIATYIVLRRHKKIASVKDFCKLIFYTPNAFKTILITAAFCAAVLLVAIRYGTRTASPWYDFILYLPILIIGGGVEEVGWRGFLQPSLERKFPYLIATLIVCAVWFVWHLPLWLQPSSHHYGDSLMGFAVTITVWAFVGSAIYKATRCVFACVMYHTIINCIGAVYDWNALFDPFPNKTGMIVYYSVALVASIALWIISDKKTTSTYE